MSYPYDYTYPIDVNSIGYSGPIPISSGDSYIAGINDTVDSRDLIRASIERILGTCKGERVMQPRFGANLKRMLFEPLDNFLLEDIREDIINVIAEQEPRINVTDVQFDIDTDNQCIYISIAYNFKNKQKSDTYSFIIK